MTKVKSIKTISFPKLNWGINAGEERELPEDKEAQTRILSEDGIEIVGEKKVEIKNSNKKEEE